MFQPITIITTQAKHFEGRALLYVTLSFLALSPVFGESQVLQKYLVNEQMNNRRKDYLIL